MFPLVRELAREGIPVSLSCRVLGFSRQGYYAWRCDTVSDRDWSDAQLIHHLNSIHAEDPTFGYHLIPDKSKVSHAVIRENRVHRLCRENLFYSSTHGRKRGSGKTPGPAVHDNLLKRDFTANRANEKWLLDITEHSASSWKPYLCSIMDCSSRRSVGYSEFAVDAMLALVLTKVTIHIGPRIMSAIGSTGIAMLAASLWLITGSTSFPWSWALLPVTGTLLLIFAGNCRNPVSQALSTKPMVKIGDWSYSIYLWHWPFMVFAIYIWPFSSYAAVVATIISLAPALASYYWVEQPSTTGNLNTNPVRDQPSTRGTFYPWTNGTTFWEGTHIVTRSLL